MLRKIIDWLSQEYQGNYKSKRARKYAIILGALWQWVVIPGFFIYFSRIVDKHLPIRLEMPLIYKVPLIFLFFVVGFYFTYYSISDLAKIGKGSFVPAAGPPKILVKNGVYKICRHPFYLGQIFLFMGLSLICSSFFILLAAVPGIITFIFFYSRLVEEKVLINQFGEEYLIYKKATPFILPFRIKRAFLKK